MNCITSGPKGSAGATAGSAIASFHTWPIFACSEGSPPVDRRTIAFQRRARSTAFGAAGSLPTSAFASAISASHYADTSAWLKVPACAFIFALSASVRWRSIIGCIFFAHSGACSVMVVSRCQSCEIVHRERPARVQPFARGADELERPLRFPAPVGQRFFLHGKHGVEPREFPMQQFADGFQTEAQPLERDDLVQPRQRVGPISAPTRRRTQRLDQPALLVKAQRLGGYAERRRRFGGRQIAFVRLRGHGGLLGGVLSGPA